jgi:hypothetical protein
VETLRKMRKMKRSTAEEVREISFLFSGDYRPRLFLEIGRVL